MSRRRPPESFPVIINATTVGPQIARAVTADPRYGEKTLAGILDQGGERLRVFRQSATEHDHLSCDIYAWSGREWRPEGKEPVKYVAPGEFRGRRVDIDGVSFYSFEDINDEQSEALRRLLRARAPSRQ